MLFHSSEAIVGGSPYNTTEGELDAFLDRLDRFLGYRHARARREAGDVSRVPRIDSPRRVRAARLAG